MRKSRKAILVAALSAVVSCAGFVIARYDPVIDGGATELQEKVDAFLTDLQQNGGEYSPDFYDEVRGDIDGLRNAAAVQSGNKLTIDSLDLIERNVATLEQMHAEGITSEEIDVVRTLFDTQFRMLIQLENAKKRKEVGP